MKTTWVPRAARRVGVDPTVVKDPRAFSLVLSDSLGAEGYEVEAVESAHKALASLVRFQPDLVITSPENGQTVSTKEFKFEGKVEEFEDLGVQMNRHSTLVPIATMVNEAALMPTL